MCSLSQSICLQESSPNEVDLNSGQTVFLEKVGQTIEMDPSVWEALPDELMVPILARLPVRSFCRLRSVCKQWNSLFQNPSFQKKWTQYPSEAPFCMMSLTLDDEPEGYAMYNPDSHTWHHLSRSFFALSRSHGVCLLASAGGLLLLKGSDEDGERILFLVNPMNKSERQLPPMLGCEDSHLIHYAKVDWCRERDTYKIIIMDRVQMLEDDDEKVDGEISMHTECQIYDSVLQSWQRTGFLPVLGARLPVEGPYMVVVSTAFHDDYLYCLIRDCYDDDFSVFRCAHELTHDSELGSRYEEELWDPVKVGELPMDQNFQHLFEHSGHLWVGVSFEREEECLGLWEFDEESRTWVKLQSILQQLGKELSFNYESQFVAQGHFKWLTFSFMEDDKAHIVICDVLKSFWWILPECPYGEYPHDTKSVEFIDWRYLYDANSSPVDFIDWRYLQGEFRHVLLLFEPRFDVLA